MNNKRLKQLLSFLENGSQDPFIKYAIATEYLKENETDLALSFYNDLMENHPDYVGTYYHLGKLYVQLGEREKAKIVFETGMSKAKEMQDGHALTELRQIYGSLILDEEDQG